MLPRSHVIEASGERLLEVWDILGNQYTYPASGNAYPLPPLVLSVERVTLWYISFPDLILKHASTWISMRSPEEAFLYHEEAVGQRLLLDPQRIMYSPYIWFV